MERIGDLTFHMGPAEVGAPDDLEPAVIEFLDAAERSLDVAVQELESWPVAEALIRAKQRRCTVRMVLENDYLRAQPTAAPDPRRPGGSNEANREILMALLRAKIDVRSDYNASIFHQKFVVRDYNRPTQGLLTGSTNFTETGLSRNLNHVMTFRDPVLVKAYNTEFREMWSGDFGHKVPNRDGPPAESLVSGVRVRALFAPDHAPEMEIVKQMLKAERRIDFAIFTFSQSSAIDDVMRRLIRDGIAVRGVLDPRQANQAWAATRVVGEVGGEIHTASRNRRGLGKLHHKLMVIDDRVTIGGSFNYTEPANRMNDENILVIGRDDEADPVAAAAQARLATYARREIDRIIDRHGRRVAPAA